MFNVLKYMNIRENSMQDLTRTQEVSIQFVIWLRLIA